MHQTDYGLYTVAKPMKENVMRTATTGRATKETQIDVTVNLDGTGQYNVSTGIGFLDHMMEQLSRHSLMDLDLKASGDLHIDMHHTVEDVGITIGEAISKALGERKGIRRYASAYIPTKLAIWIQNYLKNGSKHLRRPRV